MAHKTDEKTFFIYGFAKNKKRDLGQNELDVYRKLDKYLFRMSEDVIRKMLELKELIRVAQ